MITVEEQQSLLIAVGRRLKKRVIAYAVGGTAMMFHGFKDATLDIDLVFESVDDQEVFKRALVALGWETMDARIVYGEKRNRPSMFQLGDARFDLFVVNVVNSTFSAGMKNRAVQTRQYADNLIIRVANPHDLILMKCATDRAKDKDDVKRILERFSISWDFLVEESKQQMVLGDELAVLELGCFLEKLNTELNVLVPQHVLNELFKIVEVQAKKRMTSTRKE